MKVETATGEEIDLPTFRHLAQLQLDHAGPRDKTIKVKVTIGTARMMIRAENELLSELAQALKESHQDELNRNHYGDGPNRCSYCKLIARAEANP